MTREHEPQKLDVISLAQDEGRYYSPELPFPYAPEKFTEEERVILLRYFTNTDRPVYAIRNMDDEVAAALLSRFSRTAMSPRRLFLKEFYGDPAEGIQMLAETLSEDGRELDEAEARSQATVLYQRTLSIQDATGEKGRERKGKFFRDAFAQYGDDSVIQMGGLHMIFEGVSQVAEKAILDQRVAAGYIVRSTRYVPFTKKVMGSDGLERYLYMDVPELKGTEHEVEYQRWCNACFDTYVTAIPYAQDLVRRLYPIEDVVIADRTTGQDIRFVDIPEGPDTQDVEKAYKAAVRAKGLDLCRAFLPLTQVTNVGVFVSGQTAENMITKMIAAPAQEVQMLGLMALEEANQVIPSFLHNIPGRYGKGRREYREELRTHGERVAERWSVHIPEVDDFEHARLVSFDPDSDIKIAAAIIFENQLGEISYEAIYQWCEGKKADDVLNHPELTYSPFLADIIRDALPDRTRDGRNRRHKLPRAFETAHLTMEGNTEWGSWKDVSRARPQTNMRVRFNAERYHIPDEFKEPGMEEVLRMYEDICGATREFHRELKLSTDDQLQRAADYIAIHGNMIRFIFDTNVRQAAFLCELRSAEGGHDLYRAFAQRMTREIISAMPYLEPAFAHVDYTPKYGLGRLRAELKTLKKIGKTGGDETE